MTSDTVGLLVAGVLGAMIGSFLNVCIVRLPANQSVVRPRSRCPRCGTMVAWYDNIPILSWLVLRARCRHCREPISALYPGIELAVALLWAGMAWYRGIGFPALEGALFLTLLLGIAATDAREYIIPDEFTWGGLILGLLFRATQGSDALITAVIGAAVGFGLLWVVGAVGTWAFKEEAMGGGDVKMMAMVGAFVGWQGVLLTVFLGAFAGTLIFLPLLLLGKKKLVPFGIFLAIGAGAAYLVGSAIIGWWARYTGLA